MDELKNWDKMSEDEREKTLLKHRKKLKEKRLKVQSKLKEKEKQKKNDNIALINPSFQSDDPKGDFYISPKENKEMIEMILGDKMKKYEGSKSSGCMLSILIIVSISSFLYFL